MEKHTPGPWSIDWNVARLDIYGGDERTLIATLRRSALSEGVDAAARANALLIAAAPELLEALQKIDAMLVYSMDHARSSLERKRAMSECSGTARAAIAKATGDK